MPISGSDHDEYLQRITRGELVLAIVLGVVIGSVLGWMGIILVKGLTRIF